MMPEHDFHGRLVAIETRQSDDRLELTRVRVKVQEVAAALSAISLLTAELGRVREDVAKLGSEIPAVARRSAEEAIDVALERQLGEQRAGLGLRAQVTGAFVALVTVAVLVYDRIS